MANFNKLVRDRIPEIIKESGRECTITVLEDHDYLKSLNNKLKEELDEYYTDDDITELADLVEVIYAILKYKGISIEEFEKIRLDKKTKRGGFDKGVFLVSTIE